MCGVKLRHSIFETMVSGLKLLLTFLKMNESESKVPSLVSSQSEGLGQY